jgi:hypothetical protein
VHIFRPCSARGARGRRPRQRQRSLLYETIIIAYRRATVAGGTARLFSLACRSRPFHKCNYNALYVCVCVQSHLFLLCVCMIIALCALCMREKCSREEGSSARMLVYYYYHLKIFMCIVCARPQSAYLRCKSCESRSYFLLHGQSWD